MRFKAGLLVIVLVLAVSAVNAQDSGRTSSVMDIFGYEDSAGSHHHLENSFLDGFHNPAEGVQMGLDLRLRTIFSQNIDTLNSAASAGRSDKWQFQRYRLRWWQKFGLSEDVDFNMRWVYEFRTWDEPDRKPQSLDGDEIIPDRFNFTVRNLLDMPLTMVIGRQDIILGGGWLVLDGTPLDGSRTIFMDALRLTYQLDEASKLDAILIMNDGSSDQWLKPINDRDRYLTEQEETGVILWLTNNSIENTKLEAFYIYKNDNPIEDLSPSNIPFAWSRKARIHTIGGAISSKLNDNWSYRLDGAVQTGEREGRTDNVLHDLDAYGAKALLRYAFNDEKKNEVHAVYEYLSGDDPTSDDDEAFDPLWGEWPQFSELLVYTYSRETAIGETTNLHRLGFGHSFKATKALTVKTDYNFLWADENTTTGSGTFAMSSSEKFRGQLFTLWLKYHCCKKLNAHAVFEYFVPGSYYASSNDNDAYFLRLNFEYSF